MCPSISAISDRSFRGSVNYCMPMVLNIKEHEQFFKKCVQKMLTTALQSESTGDKHLIPGGRVGFFETDLKNSTIDIAGNDRNRLSSKHG